MDCLLISGNQQVQDLLPFRSDEIVLPGQPDLHPNPHLLVVVQFHVHQQVIYAGQQIGFVVWLADEIVRPAFQAANDILHIRERGHQNDGDTLQLFVRLDRLAQFIAGHFGHHDIADHQIRLFFARLLQRLLAIDCCNHPIAFLFQQEIELFRLGTAVFGDKDAGFS